MADKTPVMVAAIGLIGVVTAAAIANPKNVRDLFGIGGTATQGVPKSVTTPDPDPRTGSPDPAAAPVKVGGRWRSDDGYDFMFSQSGDTFSYFRMDDRSDRGSGRIAGRTLSYSFAAPEGNGSCEATVADTGAAIAGTCSRGGQSWPLSLRRPTPAELHRSL